MGKPSTQAEHLSMLRSLSNDSHQVMTAFSLRSENKTYTEMVISHIVFTTLSDKAIADYWQSGEPLDKAGGYAIQGYGASFVKHLSGSYTGVVGLPLFECARALRQFGVKV